MIQVTMNDFTANIHEYLENIDNQDIQIVREGKKPIILAVPTAQEEKDWFDKWIETAGPFDFSDPSELKRFKAERLRAKYESLD